MHSESRLILVIDDDSAIREAVSTKLNLAGFETMATGSGQEAFELIEKRTPNLIILDLGLPDIDGVTICQRIRHKSAVPIIMLTARAEEVNRIVGLEVGADDYVSKPFSLNELAARVRAVLRRRGSGASPLLGVPPAVEAGPAPAPERRLSAAGMEMDLGAKRVWVDGEEVALTPTEFKLLQALLEHTGQVVSHQQLLQAAWGDESDDTHLVEVHVGNLRSKVERGPGRPRRVKTVRGFGYRVDEESP